MKQTYFTRLAGLSIVCLFLLSACTQAQRSYNPHARQATAPGVFDYYLLNLSWAPAYCASHSGAECTEHLGFVVHGFWPENNDGSFPESCSKAAGPTNLNQYLDLIPEPSLLTHEWNVHGTCSGLAPDAYFTLDRKAFHEVTIPKLFQGLNHSVQMKPTDIITLFQQVNPTFPAGSFALACTGNQLTQVEACLTKDGIKPEACQSVKSCKAQSIQVLPQTSATAAK
jgi:ribonuclease T2